MFRIVATVLAVSAIAAVSSAPAFAQAQTIRIEPRPFYGATVTIEQGVRVWRGLPTTSHVIVNPTNAPINLSIADIRETITSHNTFTGPAYTAPSYAPDVYGTRGYYGRPIRNHSGRIHRNRASGLPAVGRR